MFAHQQHGAPAPRHHHDPRALAWELIQGFPPSRHGRGRKPHRGELPDVDWLAPKPRRGLIASVRALFGFAPVDSEMSAVAPATVPADPAPPYKEHDSNGRAAAGSNETITRDLAA